MTAARVSHEYAEAIIQVKPKARVSHLYAETMTNVSAPRVSHRFDEALLHVIPNARVSHRFDEALLHTIPNARVSHSFLEAIIRNYNVVMGLGDGSGSVMFNPLTYKQLVLQDSPAVYWSMLQEDVSGTTMLDLSGNGRNGTISGSPAYTESFYGKPCINFDGVDDVVTRANDAALNAGTGQWCMEFWMKSSYGDANYMNVCDREQLGNVGTGPLFYTRQTNGVAHAWGGTVNSVGSVVLTDGVLKHIVYQREAAGAIRLYVNGVLDTAANQTSSGAVTVTSALSVAQTTSYQRFIGLLTHFAFYVGSSLSTTRIAAHYAGAGS